jgi:forkhead box protein J2/3
MSGHDEEATTSTGTRGGAYFPAPDELDPNVAINLNSLRDAPPDGKPLYSYATLIRYVWPLFSSQTLIWINRYAIKGSPEGRLLLEEIYYAIEQRPVILV